MALNTDNQENGSSVAEIVDSGIDARKLFVGGLSGDTEENDIKQYFSKFGETESIRLKIDPVTGNSKGFAFVVFNSANSMDKVFETTEHNIKNKKVDVAKAKAKQGKIFVTGLSIDLQDDDIKKYFALYGNIVDAVFPFDTTKDVRRPFCFITFETEKSANDILEQAKHLINDHEVIVKKSMNKKNFNQSPGNFMQNKFNGNNNRYNGGQWQANRFNTTPRAFTNNAIANKNRSGAVWPNKNNGGNFNANRNFNQNQGRKWQGPNNGGNNNNAGNTYNTGNNYNSGNNYNPRNNYNAGENYNTENFNESYDQNQGGGKWQNQNNRDNNGGFNANKGFNQNQGGGTWRQNQNNAEKFQGNNFPQNQGGNQWQNQNNYGDGYDNGYFTESGGNNQNGAGRWQNRNNVRRRPY